MARVLLAEDDPDISYLVVFKLRLAGHDVTAFADGLSALTSARRDRPDVVVLDIMMPRMSGLDLCRELRTDPATADLPIVMLTARAQESDIEAGFAAGADDYIVKPFSLRELVSRIEAVLARVQA
jgi:two-component system, OmpR family, phosphate regulon response regulator PhoB